MKSKKAINLETFFSAVEQTGDSIFITDKEGKIQYVNPSFERMSGYKKEEALGNTPRIIKSGFQSEAFYKRLWSTILSGKIFRGIFANRRKNGSIFYTDHSITPIKNSKGEITHFVGIWKDVTDQFLFEKKKEDFINIANHELKTPLSSLKLFTQFIKDRLKETNDEKFIKMLIRTEDQVDRLVRLVNDLLDISSIQKTEDFEIKKELFDIGELVSDVAVGVQSTNEDYKIIVENKKSEYIFADRDRIYQVLINLLINAVKYSPKYKKITVKIDLKSEDVIISVRDLGIGISQGNKKRIFEMFYRDISSKGEFPGFGIGLFVSKKIIDLHEGKIWFESRENKGTTFYFSLPRVKET